MTAELFALLLAAVSPLAPAAEEPLLMVVSRELEEGEWRYQRTLVSPGWMRIDDGRWSPDALLFDRSAGRLYAVDHPQQGALLITTGALEEEAGLPPPTPLQVEIDGPHSAAGGEARVTIRVNQRRCLEQLVSERLPPMLLQARLELRLALAPGHRDTALVTPPEYLDPCDLALNAYHPRLALAHGAPLDESDWLGRRSVVIDYQWQPPVEPDWNRLP